jgi:hypothetical protein
MNHERQDVAPASFDELLEIAADNFRAWEAPEGYPYARYSYVDAIRSALIERGPYDRTSALSLITELSERFETVPGLDDHIFTRTINSWADLAKQLTYWGLYREMSLRYPELVSESDRRIVATPDPPD